MNLDVTVVMVFKNKIIHCDWASALPEWIDYLNLPEWARVEKLASVGVGSRWLIITQCANNSFITAVLGLVGVFFINALGKRVPLPLTTSWPCDKKSLADLIISSLFKVKHNILQLWVMLIRPGIWHLEKECHVSNWLVINCCFMPGY